MSFETFADFLAMGKHGLYVWLCYGVAVLVIAGNVLALRRQRRRFFREAAALQRRREADSA